MSMTVKFVTKCHNDRVSTLLRNAEEVVIWQGVSIRDGGGITDGDKDYIRLTNKDGVETVLPLSPIGQHEGGYDSVFVMNDKGATVHSWRSR